jgi:hypothetical protein
MRPVRLALLVLFVLGVIVLLGGAVARTYLTSTAAAQQAAAMLSKSYGGRVAVGAADINLGASQLHDVRIWEVDAGRDDLPWALAEEVQADVSLWELMSGSVVPRTVRLTRARVTLRFDETGHLQTRLPRRKRGERLPAIRIIDAQVTLQQAGRPDFVAGGIEASLDPEEGVLRLTGNGIDPRWGGWAVTGGVDPVQASSWLSLKSAGLVALSAETLRGLPFVSPKVWQAIRAEGESTVDLTVRYEPGVGRVQYHLRLEAQQTDLDVIPIDLHASNASGHVLVENGQVMLRNVRGRTADGDIQLKGDLDFRTPPSQLAFDIHVQRVDIQKLPKKWPLPKEWPLLGELVRGRLTGQAHLNVTVVQGKAKTTGHGQGELMEHPLAKNVIFPLYLNADETGFHFKPGLPRPAGPTNGAAAAAN